MAALWLGLAVMDGDMVDEHNYHVGASLEAANWTRAAVRAAALVLLKFGASADGCMHVAASAGDIEALRYARVQGGNLLEAIEPATRYGRFAFLEEVARLIRKQRPPYFTLQRAVRNAVRELGPTARQHNVTRCCVILIELLNFYHPVEELDPTGETPEVRAELRAIQVEFEELTERRDKLERRMRRQK